ncbi:MAG: hypothetical protein A3E84_04425 [Gammaproteobacteria bacterium RIFCSPHIGHO2_12_FULL_42_13]|nr:MAG: hypothetical protein A3E84_04425 [Gammaproteobacteria bacterium RIFCSPHIGHO2_12_FULL_42_13]
MSKANDPASFQVREYVSFKVKDFTGCGEATINCSVCRYHPVSNRGHLRGDPLHVPGSAEAIQFTYEQKRNNSGSYRTALIYFPLAPVHHYYLNDKGCFDRRPTHDDEIEKQYLLVVPPGVEIIRIDYDDEKKCFLVTLIDENQNQGQPQIHCFFPVEIIMHGKVHGSWLHFSAVFKTRSYCDFQMRSITNIPQNEQNPFVQVCVSYGNGEYLVKNLVEKQYYFFPSRGLTLPPQLFGPDRVVSTFFAYGSFQSVYRSSNGNVIKILNSYYSTKAFAHEGPWGKPGRIRFLLKSRGISASIVSASSDNMEMKYHNLLEMPYFERGNISHEKVCKYFIDAYRGINGHPETYFRLLHDFFAKGSLDEAYSNLREMADTTLDCVDPALSLQINERCSSPGSRDAWAEWGGLYQAHFLKCYKKAKEDEESEESKVIFVFLSILFLQKHCPAYRDLSALLDNKELRMRCAEGYAREANGTSVNFDDDYWQCIWRQYPRSNSHTQYFSAVDSLEPVKIDISLPGVVSRSPVYDVLSETLQEHLKKIPMLPSAETEAAANEIVATAREICNEVTLNPRCVLSWDFRSKSALSWDFSNKIKEYFEAEISAVIQKLKKLKEEYEQQNRPGTTFNEANQRKLSWVQYLLSILSAEPPRKIISPHQFLLLDVTRFDFVDLAPTEDSSDSSCASVLKTLKFLAAIFPTEVAPASHGESATLLMPQPTSS